MKEILHIQKMEKHYSQLNGKVYQLVAIMKCQNLEIGNW